MVNRADVVRRLGGRFGQAVLLGWLLVGGGAVALAQMSAADLDAMRAQGEREGWTFTVGPTSATERPRGTLHGLKPPTSGAAAGAETTTPLLTTPVLRDVPSHFDWREHTELPPIRDQASCGACWAFSTCALLECAILRQDGVGVNLSEQWLIDCNTELYGCDGGWFAYDYFLDRPDSCGGVGAVLEEDVRYTGRDNFCGCPYDHYYKIESWDYVVGSDTIPAVASIKQAVYNHGPVGVAFYASDAFDAYTGGVFNAPGSGEVNHGVVIIGWDDNEGTSGAWIVRNSWGTNWGIDGYGLVAYGCAKVGYGASYITYASAAPPELEVTPTTLDFGAVSVGELATKSITIRNAGGGRLTGSVAALNAPFAIVGGDDYSLLEGESRPITIRFTPTLRGDFAATLSIADGAATVTLTGSGTGAAAADHCAGALAVSLGGYTANNASADTEVTASCAGGYRDVWWRYANQTAGRIVFDTCGSSVDTVLSVYSTCSGEELACADSGGACPDGAAAAELELEIAAGADYLVRVAAQADVIGTLALNITRWTPPVVVAGHVRRDDGSGLADVTLMGLPGAPLTNADGFFTVEVPTGFSGTVTPTKAGYEFTPEMRQLSTLAEDTTADFTAAERTLTIAGHVRTAEGDAVAGVTLAGLPGDPITDEQGAYSVVVAYSFSATVVPMLTGWEFDPSERAYAELADDRPAEDYTGQLITYTLAGRFTDARTRGVAGVTLAGLPDNVVTDDDGYYLAEVPEHFGGTITPQKPGYLFEPAALVLDDVVADRDDSWQASVQSFAIAGTVIDADGQPVANVRMSGLPGTPFTNSQGRYSATVTYGFAGTVRPEKTGWAFDPPATVYDGVTEPVLAADYVGMAATFVIAGRITTVEGEGLIGVQLVGLPGDVLTDGDGRYAATVTYGFTAQVTPALDGYTFAPQERVYAALATDALDENYQAIVMTGALRITLVPGDAVTAGAAWRVDGGHWRASGVTLTGLSVGPHTVGYRAADGWIAPPTESVDVAHNRSTWLTRRYSGANCVLTLVAEPAGAGSIAARPAAADQTYEAGTVVRLTAQPEDGYTIDGWEGADDVTGTDGAEATVALNTDRTVTVRFTKSAANGIAADQVTPIDNVDSLTPCGGAGACGAGIAPVMPLTLLVLLGSRRAWKPRGRRR